jgi:hypothetical protein
MARRDVLCELAMVMTATVMARPPMQMRQMAAHVIVSMVFLVSLAQCLPHVVEKPIATVMATP